MPGCLIVFGSIYFGVIILVVGAHYFLNGSRTLPSARAFLIGVGVGSAMPVIVPVPELHGALPVPLFIAWSSPVGRDHLLFGAFLGGIIAATLTISLWAWSLQKAYRSGKKPRTPPN